MTKDEAIGLILARRAADWNNYRSRNPDWVPDLSDTDLSDVQLVPNGIPFNLSGANLCRTKLPKEVGGYKGFSGTSIRWVDLTGALIDYETQYPVEINLVSLGTVYVTRSEQEQHVRPIVFISYAWANEDVVLALEHWLSTKGLATKIDRRDFFAGSRIRDEIMRVMAQCDVILIFYSQQAKDKPWPQFERELAADLEMAAKQKGTSPPRTIYVVIDGAEFPSVTEANRLAVMAKGKRFELVAEEIYHNILQLPKPTEEIDLSKWSDYVF